MKIDKVTVHGKRRVFVSWKMSDPDRLDWKNEFWERLDADTGLLDDTFESSLQSDPAESGELARERLGALLRRAPDTSPVTDVVAVLTNEYIARNTDRGELHADGELAQFIDHVKAHDHEDTVRIFIAPLDKPNWKIYRVRDVRLEDAGDRHKWLELLRKERYTWPSESRPKSADEIAEAVERITDERPPAAPEPPT